jgi:FixJ family two-component response regulator
MDTLDVAHSNVTLEPAFAQEPACVWVVDEDESVRESLESQIRTAGLHPETYGSAAALLERLQLGAPHCLILDVSLPDLGGLQLQRRIVDAELDVPIIFLSRDSDVRASVQAIKAGAVEFLVKPFGDDQLLAAIRDALARSTAALHHQSQLREMRGRHAALSSRERQVMSLVTVGLLNKQIGDELGISEITVKAHRGKVMRKMRARSLAELVRMATTLGLSAER